jgi:hypothetical protein
VNRLGKHIVVSEDGVMTTSLCPRQGRDDKPGPRYTTKQGRYLAFEDPACVTPALC